MSYKMHFNNKSQGLSLNVIIIAAIVLIVLIVLWAIFTGKMGSFTKEMDECRGSCISKSSCKSANGIIATQKCDEGELVKEETTAAGTESIVVKTANDGDNSIVCCIMANK